MMHLPTVHLVERVSIVAEDVRRVKQFLILRVHSLRLYTRVVLSGTNSGSMTQSQNATRVCALGLMAKAPVAGEVKTRLVPPFTAREDAGLHVCFLPDMGADSNSIFVTDVAGPRD